MLTVGREERNCGVVGTHSKEGGMAATIRGTLLASGLGESQVGFSESNGAQEAQEKICREGEMAIAGTSVPMANRPGGLTWACTQVVPPRMGGLEL